MAEQDYLNLITPEHKSQPKYTAWLTAALTLLDDAQTALTDMVTAYDIDTAVGAQLDALGVTLGVSRLLSFQPTTGSALLDDDNYRFVLKAKIMSNQWDGTRAEYESMVGIVLAGCRAVLADNLDMSMDVVLILDTAPTLISELLQHNYLIPAPSGVSTKFAAAFKGTWDWYYYQYTWDELANYTWDELASGI